MMRGSAHWAVAVRRPDGGMFIRSYEMGAAQAGHPFLRRPLVRGIVVLGQSLAIGVRALMIATNESAGDDVDVGPREVVVVLGLAAVIFIGVFILAPAALFGWVSRSVGGNLLANVAEGLLRVAMFVGYLWLIGRVKGVNRVFQYHGAEHKTIAAHEHGVPLDPGKVDSFPKEHVRCGDRRDHHLHPVQARIHRMAARFQAHRDPADRGAGLRGAEARRAAPRLGIHASPDGPGPLAPGDHHEGPRSRADRGRDRILA
jgi:hypothetical protein